MKLNIKNVNIDTGKNFKVYLILLLILSISAFISVFLPHGDFLPMQKLPTTKLNLAIINFLIMFLVYGGLGIIGIKLSGKINFADIWEDNISLYKKVIQPMIVGIGLGFFFIITDYIISNFHTFGKLPHPPFPLSIFASVTAGIGEEIITRLFFVSFWVWLIYYIIFNEKYFRLIFWIIAVFSAIIFTFMHIPSIYAILDIKSMDEIPGVLMAELFILNGSLSLFAAWHLKRYGFVAAVGIHFWADIVWHVIYGMFSNTA